MSKLFSSWCVRVWLGLTLAAGMVAAQAAGDPPGRVGRLAELDGSGWLQQGGQGEWAGLQRNQPLTTGDWISTDPGSRARVEIGSTVLRLDGGTVLQVRRLDDERIDLWLQSGAVSARIRQPEVIRELSLSWAQGSLQPTSTGAYVLRQDDEGTRLSVLAGEGRFNSPARSFSLRAGQSVELNQSPGSRQLDITWTDLPQDRFVTWVQDEDLRNDWARDNPPVSSEMTGADDLNRYGRWEQSPEYGMVWQPMVVTAGWAPYRYGRWLWVAPWGWTWVDDAPWGFAPFHYGRWAYWGSRWVWVPGAYVRRPVYAPALVGWVGGSGWSVSINAGPPTVGWVPLAPMEPFVPVYVYTPVYYQRVNPWRPPLVRYPLAAGAIDYRNRLAPGGATWVPAQVVQAQQPVWRAVRPQDEEYHGRVPLVPVAPPSRPVGPLPGQGGSSGGRVPPAPGWGHVPVQPVQPWQPQPVTPAVPRQPVPGSGDNPSDERRHPLPVRPAPVNPMPVTPSPTAPVPQLQPSTPARQPDWPGAGREARPMPVPHDVAPWRQEDSEGERWGGGHRPPGQAPQPAAQPQPVRPMPEARQPEPVPRAMPPAPRAPAMPAYQPVPARQAPPAAERGDPHGGGRRPGAQDEDKRRDNPQR
ncbi:DUF6600 domain-containing protein [Ideonella sp. B508-1]|uniref:DUF6600 domain-containing protein n=1 Tax=Ideonella sp. B508-1 TaxID=137716 RepID=UPI0003B3FBF1|nr:DUF6600 domain-containing protein [Ideonella sp. B508-1]